MTPALLILALAAFAEPTPAVSSLTGPTAEVPTVGCETDGQQGRQPPPEPGKPVSAPASVAGDLAWYQSQDLGVLAPRGWHCFALSGSNGGALFVTPEEHGDDLFEEDKPLTGPIVLSRYSISGTSGRFEAARMAARLFPARKAFVKGVMSEEGVDRSEYVFGPYKTDKVTRLAASTVVVLTPAGKAGAAVADRMGPGDLPAFGYIRMDDKDNLYAVSIRLPEGQDAQASAILMAATKRPE